MQRRILNSLVIGIFCLVPVFSLQAQSCKLIEAAYKDAIDIRGLKKRASVPCEIHDRKQIEAFLKETVKTKLPQNKLKMEGLVSKAIGIVPDSYDYEQGVLELYLSQIGGYYDPEKNRFIMASWIPDSMQHVVAVHELTHALQDQHWNLEKIIDPKATNSDEAIAHSALVEGDATAVMTDHTMSLVGQPGLADTQDISGILMQQVMSSGMMSGVNEAPEALKNILFFPYTSGLRFAHTLLRKGGYREIDRAYSRLPKSTEEILHPEKYLANQKDFIEFSDQDLKTAAQSETLPVYTDTVGEFAVTAIIGSALKNNRAAASEIGKGWGGDRIGVFGGEGKHTVVWLMNWDTEKDAEEFEAGYKNMLKKTYSLSEKCFQDESCSLTVKKMVSIERNGPKVSIVFEIKK